MSGSYTIGLDFGTNSVRALIVDVAAGEEIATAVWDYRRGEAGVVLDPNDPHLARQGPADYVEGVQACIRDTLGLADTQKGFSPDRVIGIGVDTTGSTPLPVDETGMPLAFRQEFEGNLNALAWLWKDHTGHAEAEEITEAAARLRPHYLAKCGGKSSFGVVLVEGAALPAGCPGGLRRGVHVGGDGGLDSRASHRDDKSRRSETLHLRGRA